MGKKNIFLFLKFRDLYLRLIRIIYHYNGNQNIIISLGTRADIS